MRNFMFTCARMTYIVIKSLEKLRRSFLSIWSNCLLTFMLLSWNSQLQLDFALNHPTGVKDQPGTKSLFGMVFAKQWENFVETIVERI